MADFARITSKFVEVCGVAYFIASSVIASRGVPVALFALWSILWMPDSVALNGWRDSKVGMSCGGRSVDESEIRQLAAKGEE